MTWKRKRLIDLFEIIGGGTPKTTIPEYWNGNIPWLSVKDFNNSDRYVYKTEKTITNSGLKNSSTKLLEKDDIIISARGTVGELAMIPYPMAFNQSCYGIRGNEEVDKTFLYYLLKNSITNLKNISHGSVFDTITRETFSNITVDIPDKDYQRKIAKFLSNLDNKIELNKRINDNLEKQIMAIFQHMFGEKNKNRKNIRADEYFDISIGKTPPRKEPQWFSKNPSDYVWVSISDMGNCGLYIEDSSEHLSIDAVKMFNIKIVPDNTVILSFKLTVGRVAITDGYMTTNEAIAHFKTDKPKITEYLYCYLKNFNFQTMGSTSSIATAINSKIIKKMSFVVPTNEELEKFHNIAAPMFMLIKLNQRENKYMNELRDGLLPKLMSGEVDISNLNI